MPFDVRHDGEGEPTDHREIHNVYGLLMTQSTYEGLLKLRPDEPAVRADARDVLGRPALRGALARRQPGPTGTTSARTIPMFANLGLSGMPFVGADIGGFAEAPDARALHALAAGGRLLPVHAHAHHVRHARPGAVVVRHRAARTINRRAIELRYQLLPHLYNLMEEASRTGAPVFRPLFYEYPDDPATCERDDEFLWGRDLLVAPVLREGVTDREVYLPKGDWYDFWTGGAQCGRPRASACPSTIDDDPDLRARAARSCSGSPSCSTRARCRASR